MGFFCCLETLLSTFHLHNDVPIEADVHTLAPGAPGKPGGPAAPIGPWEVKGKQLCKGIQ